MEDAEREPVVLELKIRWGNGLRHFRGAFRLWWLASVSFVGLTRSVKVEDVAIGGHVKALRRRYI